jgi:hypothetical protein
VNGISLKDYTLTIDIRAVRDELDKLYEDREQLPPNYDMALQSLDNLLSYTAFYVRESRQSSEIIIEGSMASG